LPYLDNDAPQSSIVSDAPDNGAFAVQIIDTGIPGVGVTAAFGGVVRSAMKAVK